MDPILYMMLCSTVEAASSVFMAVGLMALAIVEIRREFHAKRRRPRIRVAGRPGTWGN